MASGNLPACCEAGRGATSIPTTCARLIATTIIPAIVTTITVFVWWWCVGEFRKADMKTNGVMPGGKRSCLAGAKKPSLTPSATPRARGEKTRRRAVAGRREMAESHGPLFTERGQPCPRVGASACSGPERLKPELQPSSRTRLSALLFAAVRLALHLFDPTDDHAADFIELLRNEKQLLLADPPSLPALRTHVPPTEKSAAQTLVKFIVAS